MNLLLAAAFVFIWGSAFNAARVVAVEWPPLWGIAIRFAVVAVLLGAIWAWRRAPLPAAGDRGRLALLGVFGTGGYLGCAWVASAHVPSGLVALLSATAPLFVALGQRLQGEAVSPRAWAGLTLGWTGVALLGLSRSLDGLERAEAWGLGVALLGALSHAAGLLAYAPARERVDAWTANAGQTVVAAVTLLLVAGLLSGDPPPASASPALLLAMLWSCLVVGLLGYALFFVVMRRFPPATAASLQLLAPPVAAVIGWALMGERLGWGDLLGGAITLAGLALLFRRERAPG
ncbi:MAG: EamA family transporter [Acetobacteraceae bacterium]|nr:EamA family transporter [Acetobacteraceae bacterium]